MTRQPEMTPAALDEMLVDVRHAWRLIAAYQQRILYLVQQVEKAFSGDLAFSGWWNGYGLKTPARSWQKPWEQWIWDYLPLYGGEIWFEKSKGGHLSPAQAGDWCIVVRWHSDDAFSTSAPESASFNGPDPTLFAAVEETKSIFYLHAYQVTDPELGKNMNEVWHRSNPHGVYKKPKDFKDTARKEVLAWQEGVWMNLPELGAQALRISASMSDVMAEGGIERKIEELRAKLREVDIHLAKAAQV